MVDGSVVTYATLKNGTFEFEDNSVLYLGHTNVRPRDSVQRYRTFKMACVMSYAFLHGSLYSSQSHFGGWSWYRGGSHLRYGHVFLLMYVGLDSNVSSAEIHHGVKPNILLHPITWYLDGILGVPYVCWKAQSRYMYCSAVYHHHGIHFGGWKSHC